MDAIGVVLRGGVTVLLLAASVVGAAGQDVRLEQASKTDTCRLALEKTGQLIVNRSLHEALHLLLGRVLARLNQSAEAEREFELSKDLQLKHGGTEKP